MGDQILSPDATLEDWVTHRGLPVGTTLSQLVEIERVQARLAGTFDALRVSPGTLRCVFCLHVPCEPPTRRAEDDDPPHDGLAVTVVAGTAVCECHLNAVLPDDVAWLIGRLREQARERDTAGRHAQPPHHDDKEEPSRSGATAGCTEREGCSGASR